MGFTAALKTSHALALNSTSNHNLWRVSIFLQELHSRHKGMKHVTVEPLPDPTKSLEDRHKIMCTIYVITNPRLLEFILINNYKQIGLR